MPRPYPEKDTKFKKFSEVYIHSGNAYRSAIQAGYTKEYAKGSSYLLAARIELKMHRALREQCVDEVQLASFLKRMYLSAKTVKWNPKREEFEEFLDNGARLRAAEMILKCLDAFPSAKHENVDGGQPDKVQIITSVPAPERGEKTVVQ